jgi:hypothetical protein
MTLCGLWVCLVILLMSGGCASGKATAEAEPEAFAAEVWVLEPAFGRVTLLDTRAGR